MPLSRQNLIEQVVNTALEIISQPQEDSECSICYEKWQLEGAPMPDVVRTNLCKHYFHRECLLTWFCSDDQEMAIDVNNSCPLCRREVFEFVPLTIPDIMDELDAQERTQDAFERRFERHMRILGSYVVEAMYEPDVNGQLGTPEGIDAMIRYVMGRWSDPQRHLRHGWMSVPLVPIAVDHVSIRYVILLHLGWSMPNLREPIDPRLGESLFFIARDRHRESFNQAGREYAMSLLASFQMPDRRWTEDELALFREAPRYLSGNST